MPAWIIVVQWMSRSVLVFLVALSVWSVATMLRCSRLLKQAGGQAGGEKELSEAMTWIGSGAWDTFRSWAASSTSLHAGTARVIVETPAGDVSRVDRAVKSHLNRERTRLEQGLTVLATLGSNAAFIGLFGTVLGIIQAFGALGAKQANPQDIMVGIAEALIATAVGLFVAIPAVVAFNVFTRRLRVMIVNSEALKDYYLSKVKTEH